MIGRLRGTLAEVSGGMALVDAGGVGYEVAVPESVSVRLPGVGEPVELIVRQVVREDGWTLYGFLEPFERRMFDLLLDVKGCGPRIALSLIGQVGAEAAAAAIVTGDAKALTRANGVGARLAERMVLELKEKVADEQFALKVAASDRLRAASRPKFDEPLVEALLALGYRRNEAESAAAQVQAQSPDESLEEQLKLAIRSLTR
ncbi:MAG: Holliday junction branch migration protein RuvA [Fimbriimonadaceae bacterium]